MKIFPVIDLKDGRVVHAKHGNRDEYRPIMTPLCQSAEIDQVVLAFLSLYDFDAFYIADLNSIGHQGNHDRMVAELTDQYRDKIFWIDRGFRPEDLIDKLPDNHLPVIGSESLTEGTLKFLKSPGNSFVLSLDYSLSGPLGPNSLFTDPGYWPDTLIIMTLPRVGGGSGPDFSLLRDFCRNHPNKEVTAAGGIRNKQDLIDLNRLGIERALVATALHSGDIGSDDIAYLEGF